MRMPIAIAAATLLGLGIFAVDARAQGPVTNMGPDTARAQMQSREEKEKPPKADEKAYQDALKAVPPPKKVDPWGNMR